MRDYFQLESVQGFCSNAATSFTALTVGNAFTAVNVGHDSVQDKRIHASLVVMMIGPEG